MGVRSGTDDRHGHHGPGLAAASRDPGFGSRPANAGIAGRIAKPSGADAAVADAPRGDPQAADCATAAHPARGDSQTAESAAAAHPAGPDTDASGPDPDAPRPDSDAPPGDPDATATHLDPAGDAPSSAIRCAIAEPIAEPVAERIAIDPGRWPDPLRDDPGWAGGGATGRCVRRPGSAPIADDRRSRVAVRFVRHSRPDPRRPGDHHPRDPRRAARSRGGMDAGHPALAQPAGLTVDRPIRCRDAAYHRHRCQA
jgi:hypothetical protein